MSKNTLLFSVVLWLLETFHFSTALAQNPRSYYEEVPHLFTAGLIVGSNFSQIDGDNVAGYTKLGLCAGGVLYTNFSSKVSISLEILYSQKGSRSSFAYPSVSKLYNIIHYSETVNYAEIPLLFNLYDKRKSHASIGFSYNQLISTKETAETIPQIPVDYFNSYPFKKNDINFLLGASVHIINGLYAGLRFQYSLVSVRNTYPPEFGRTSQYNNLYSLRVMYLFGN